MEMEIRDELAATVERLAAAAGMLEQAVERLGQRETEFAASAEASLERVVATVDATAEVRREKELARQLAAKLAAAEQRIAELEARAVPAAETFAGRKTVPAAAASLFAKHGMTGETIQAGALDAALVHLSLEQRIAVKAELMRSGMIG